jgi:hypothetical protein
MQRGSRAQPGSRRFSADFGAEWAAQNLLFWRNVDENAIALFMAGGAA